jgi:hypothetical protein
MIKGSGSVSRKPKKPTDPDPATLVRSNDNKVLDREAAEWGGCN